MRGSVDIEALVVQVEPPVASRMIDAPMHDPAEVCVWLNKGGNA
jgi:hypothetical protein